MDNKFTDEVRVKGEDLLKKVKEIVKEGNARRIIIKNDKDEVFLEIPLTIGVVGALLVPVWAAIGALAAVAVDFKVQVIKKEDDQEDNS